MKHTYLRALNGGEKTPNEILWKEIFHLMIRVHPVHKLSMESILRSKFDKHKKNQYIKKKKRKQNISFNEIYSLTSKFIIP